MIHEVKGAGEVVADIVAEARGVLQSMGGGLESFEA